MKNKILNNIDHRELKVDTRPDRSYGDVVNRALAFTTEYSDLHKEFPILLYRDPYTEEFHGHVILGFEKDENLFIENNEWQARCIPATMARGPFSIGYQKREQGAQDSIETVIMVNENDPRCNSGVGEPVFLEFGGESPYLAYIKRTLNTIDSGLKLDKLFFTLMEECELIEPVSIDVSLDEGRKINFKNYYTISEEKLVLLDVDKTVKLHKSGVFGLIYFVLSSMGNFQKLIELKNAKS